LDCGQIRTPFLLGFFDIEVNWQLSNLRNPHQGLNLLRNPSIPFPFLGISEAKNIIGLTAPVII
jgi:hypothetical protein